MARRTGFEFYRKRQTIESLATERPQSLKTVYDIVNEAVERVEGRLDMLMTSYYGGHETLDGQIKKWLPMFLLLMRQGRCMEVISKEQLNEFVIKHDNLLDRSPFEQELLDSVNDVISHIFDTVWSGFKPITKSLQEVVGFMGKYLKSFSPADGDRYLETCTNYEKQKNALERAILLNIENIYLMARKFEKECLTMDHFDYISKERLEKYGCIHVPVLLLFPAACDNIKNAFSGIRKWIEADANYVEYLLKDMRELEQKREHESRELKDLQFKVSCKEYKFKSLNKEIEQLSSGLDRLKSKELIITEEEKSLSDSHKNLNVDLEIKLYRLSEMKQTSPRNAKNRLYKEQLERLNTEITLLKDKRPKLDRSLTDIQSKKSWISDRKQELAEKEAELEDVRSERRKLKKLARKSEVEIMRINDCIQKLKDIKTMKTSEEVLRRLFHNLPVLSRSLHAKKRLDKLDRAITLVSRYIDSDWSKLYWQLPFYPVRGEETKRQDIDDIIKNFIRHTPEDQAKQSLLKWRRVHTRATLACLKDALTELKRKDIVDILNKELKSRIKCSVNPKLYRTVHFPEIPVSDCFILS